MINISNLLCDSGILDIVYLLYCSNHYLDLLLRIVLQVQYTEDGLEAIVFTAQGDMRQALNNLQSTHNGFGEVNSANVFKVCDEPHPMLIKDMLKNCIDGDIRKAYKVISYSNTAMRYFLKL